MLCGQNAEFINITEQHTAKPCHEGLNVIHKGESVHPLSRTSEIFLHTGVSGIQYDTAKLNSLDKGSAQA
jgi:hypothetical protein